MTKQEERQVIGTLSAEEPRWSEAHLRVLLQHSNEFVALLTADGRITYASASLQQVLGYQPEDYIGTNIFSIIHPDHQNVVVENVRTLLQEPATVVQMEYPARHKDGGWIWIAATYSNHLHTPGIESIVGNLRNITQCKQTEEERDQLRARERTARTAESRLWRLVNSNIIGVSFTLRTGAIIDANDRFLRMLGYTHEDLSTGKLTWTKLTPPEYAERDKQALQEIQQYGAVSHPYEKEYITKDGSRIPVLVGGASIDAIQGEIVTFIIDIRQQKQMERDLRTAKEHLEAILYNAGDGITVYDAEGNLLYVNDLAATMCGFPSAEAMLSVSEESYRQTIRSRFIVKDEEGNILSREDFPGYRALREGRNVQKLLEYKDTVTERTSWSLLKSQPIINEDGQTQFVVNVIVDMSERQALEQRKNEFISMASHELKTPITSLKGFTHVLQRRFTREGDEQALHYLLRIETQLNKLAKLINDLLDISKMQAGKLDFQEELVDLTALIDEVVEAVQETTTTHHISIEERADIRVVGDKDRLGQVLINLLTNAIKYSPHANKVIVRAVTDGEYATVSVQDFGIGIAAIHHQHVFERFYQVTEAREKTYPGLGIGLYIVHTIIKRHHGNIWVESSQGEGATFFFTLPLAKESPQIADCL
jgi:PAS domain S-box-containing protein